MRLIATRRYDIDEFWDTQKLYGVGTSYALHHKSDDPDEPEYWKIYSRDEARQWLSECPEQLVVCGSV